MFLFVWGDGLVRMLKFVFQCRSNIHADPQAQQRATMENNECRSVPDNHAPVSTQVLFFLIGIAASLMSPWLALLAIGVLILNMLSIVVAVKHGAINLNQTEVDVWLPVAMLGCLWFIWLAWFVILVPLDKDQFAWRLGVVAAVLLVSIAIETMVVKIIVRRCFNSRRRAHAKTLEQGRAKLASRRDEVEVTIETNIALTEQPDIAQIPVA